MSNTHATLVSIVMPAFNAADTLPTAVASVQQQDHPSWELFIIDDGSNDNTPALILEYAAKDPRIKFIQQPFNQGVAAARNAGIKAAQGRYLAFLDSDDLWFPHKLSKQLKTMQEHQATVSMTAYYRFQQLPQWQSTSTPPLRVDYKNLLKGNAIGNLTGMYDCQELGKVYQKAVRHEDYLMWLEIVRRAGMAYGLQEVLAAYRVSAASLSANKLKSLQWTWQIYRRHLKLPVVQSSYLMFHYIVKAILKRA
ncbi:glycosyltransferase family 2 protein [Alcaligenes sp. A-TC2]|uniref:glycosyltransferase family 2 protein n=1 Tax=Alcaligenes TaxID=507 RepID=UPI0020A8163C|nr:MULTISPECIES: glycosyltransferase family 2 protein [Alcaligenes]MCX5471947.1 glycosyltransferase family 2 protein [Alcaligenes nematophilus]USY25028.1 glycosyltransferase family 2 protein [Alcaligenes sp. 1735tsa3]